MFRQYYSSETPETLLEKPGVLSVVTFDTACSPSDVSGIVPVGLESLSDHRCEVIECDEPVLSRGQTGRCQWSHSDNLMCAAVWLSPEECKDIAAGAEEAYEQLLGTLQKHGFAHPFRIWNFIPNINVGPGDREEYKRFCVGRLNAFTELSLTPDAFPAASALGHHSEGAVIYALATHEPGIHYENPRQESAYLYPRQYGPSSPSFSRATKIKIEGREWVFISGTASILGHETRCPGDLNEQLAITVSNIEFLANHISQNAGPLTAIRVYLRHKQDLDMAQKVLSKHFAGCEITYNFADICRSNLLVEIEAAFAIAE